MTKKRKIALVFLYVSIVAAMLFMFLYVQKRYRHNPSKKRTAIIESAGYVVFRQYDTGAVTWKF